jgi:hypothetical protein
MKWRKKDNVDNCDNWSIEGNVSPNSGLFQYLENNMSHSGQAVSVIILQTPESM